MAEGLKARKVRINKPAKYFKVEISAMKRQAERHAAEQSNKKK